MGSLYLTISAVSRCIYLYLLTKVTVRALPILSCDFDNGLEGCKDIKLDKGHSLFDWSIKSGPSSTILTNRGTLPNTGPKNDNTRKDSTGKYIYIDSSFLTNGHPRVGHMNGDIAIFQSVDKSVNPRRPLCLTFAYHMKGLTTGTLSVILVEQGEENIVFQLSGEQGPDWKMARVWIPAHRKQKGKRTLKVKFRARLSYGFTSDIAIDDINMQVTRPNKCRAWPPEAKPTDQETKTEPEEPRNGPEDPNLCGTRPKLEKVQIPSSLSQIMGGTITKPGQWPWMALISPTKEIKKNITPYCGGVLLGTSWVVTAAHCVFDMEKRSDFNVFLGINNIRKPGKDVQIRKIAEVYIHTEYNKEKPFNNDIALIKLNTPARLSRDKVNSICLPGEDVEIKEGEKLKVAGYGRLGPSPARFANVLHEADVTKHDCARKASPRDTMIHPLEALTPNMICAGKGADQRITDTCIADSGGPLMYKSKKNHWVLAGITSWGDGECGKKYGVYTKVTQRDILKWIKIVTNNNSGGDESRLKFREPEVNQVITR